MREPHRHRIEEATARFAELVTGPEPALTAALDEAALLIAAHANPALDVAAYRRKLDDLAASCAEPVLAEVSHRLFEVEGFRGNEDDYYDPRNSYLDQVLDRRLGIPITLAVVLIEVSRRLGIAVAGVGMPGHFLVRLPGEPVVLLDPFEGGRLLGRSDCEARFHSLYGPGARFDPAYLEPVGPRAVVSRILANLRQVHVAGNDSVSLEWVLHLRGLIPGATVEDRAERAAVLVALGQFDQAADLLEALAEEVPDPRAAQLSGRAKGLRARLN